jgi:Bacterial regulatory proteins, gntR family
MLRRLGVDDAVLPDRLIRASPRRANLQHTFCWRVGIRRTAKVTEVATYSRPTGAQPLSTQLASQRRCSSGATTSRPSRPRSPSALSPFARLLERLKLILDDHVLLSGLAAEFGVSVQTIRERLRMLEDTGHLHVLANAAGMWGIIISETGQKLRLIPPRRKSKTEG